MNPLKSTSFTVPDFHPGHPNQGSRATCVAFALTALLEYYYRDRQKQYSPQYLYARCKLTEQNGVPETNFENAMRCVNSFGMCEYTVWPYQTNEPKNDFTEAQLNRLPVEDCSKVIFKLLLTPNNVNEIKSHMSGGIRNQPMPVLIGCTVFATGKVQTESGNWFREPCPNDNSGEGHAMLLYGWVDTDCPGLLSKGYFIAQDSISGNTGTSEVKIPFEYIEKYATSAATIVAPAVNSAAAQPTKATVQAVSEVPSATLLQPPQPQKDNFAMKDQFFDSIESNIGREIYFYPALALPFLHRWLLKEINYQAVTQSVADYSAPFRDWRQSSHPDLPGTVSLKCYSFRITAKCCYYLACVFFEMPNAQNVSGEQIAAVREFLQASCCRSNVKHLFMTLGTNTAFDKNYQPLSNPTTILCEYQGDGLWSHRYPDLTANGSLANDFLAHLAPGFCKDKITEIIQNWNQLLDPPITIDRLRERMGFAPKELDKASIVLALDEMFRTGDYAKSKSGEIIPWKLWGDGVPSNAKICYRYSPPGKRLNLQLYLCYFSAVFFLLLGAAKETWHWKFPLWLTLSVAALSFCLGILRRNTLLKFKYNIK